MWAVGSRDVALWAALLAVCAVAVALVHRREPRDVAARGWASTKGTILTASIQVQRTGSARREVPIVVYAYRVGQEAFRGSCIRASADRQDSSRRSAGCSLEDHARRVLARYPVGASVMVYYDPSDPSHSALEP